MAMAKKGLNIKVAPDEIVHTSITKSKDYSSARLVSKIGEKAYMSISVEWEGDAIPAFAMDLMGTLQASKIEPNTVVDEKAYVEYMGKDEERAAKKCPSCGTSCDS